MIKSNEKIFKRSYRLKFNFIRTNPVKSVYLAC